MRDKINYYSKKGIPFIFIIDFDGKEYDVTPVSEIDKSEILYNIYGFTNYKFNGQLEKGIEMKKHPISFSQYKKGYKIVDENFYLGNSFLLNYTCKTKIDINLSLREIYKYSNAKYKLYYKDRFVVFSPETFVKIRNGMISTYPMKGTIDADIPNAEKKLLENRKEFAEHTTIVDLLRNDIGKVSKKVWVEKFRYIDRLETNDKNLLQVSSKICGNLDNNYKEKLGDIICDMLPAGSISGAPKKKTVEIIKEAENYDRGFYTGIFGYFDGKNLDSGVMIRFIEKEGEQFFYKSGGGITVYSNPKLEYEEMIDKIYVPINRNNKGVK